MTTYRVDPVNDRMVVASWPDLPIHSSASVGPFADTEMVMTAESVLNVVSRYRWHRMLQLWDEGVFTDAEAGPDPIVNLSRSTTVSRSLSPIGDHTNRGGFRVCRRTWFSVMRR